jgi:hypothetical protein
MNMTYINLTQIERTYKIRGQHCEQLLAYNITGEIRTHDSKRFDKASDIPEIDCSVKSEGFTLSQRLVGETKEEQIADFFNRSVSKVYAYVTKDFQTAVMMDKAEFEYFLREFCSMTRASQKCGGMKVLKMRSESKAVRAYLGI